MPAHAQAAYVYVGVLPPQIPDTKTLWLSQSVGDLRVPPGPGDRKAVISPTLTWEGTVVQEPNVWYANGIWNMLYTGHTSTPGIGYASAPTPLGPWTKLSAPVIGQNTGGFVGNAAHSSLYIEGSTLYCFFTDKTNNLIKVASAALSAPTVWTTLGTVFSLPSGTTQMGNSFVIKEGSTYHMFYEVLLSSIWQSGIAACATVGGTYVSYQLPLMTLWPNTSRRMAGGSNIIVENGVYWNYYHAGNNTGTLPTDGYRAFSTDKINWTVDLNGYPLVRRVTPQEIDQVADMNLAQGPNEGWWGFWTGYDNQTPAGYIMCSPMLPTLKRWDGYAWAAVLQSSDPQGALDYITVDTQTASYTARHREDVPMDATSGNLTCTLPAAAKGSFCRAAHIGTGANTVAIAAAGADTVLGTNASLTTGQMAEFHCRTAGKWCRLPN